MTTGLNGSTNGFRGDVMTSRLKFLLPVVQTAIALVLGVWSYFQYQKEVSGGISYDYVPPAGLLLHILNLPAALVLSLIMRNASLQIGLQHSVPVFIFYLALISALWFAIGWRLAIGRGAPSPRTETIRNGLGITAMVTALLMVVLGVLSLQGPLSLLIPVFAFAWAIVLVVLFRRWLPWIGRTA